MPVSRVLTCSLVAVAVAGLPAGCGGSKPETSSSASSSNCIRAHGVPNFPDPTFGPGGHGAGVRLPADEDPQSPAIRNAAKACADAGTSIPGVGIG
jgi:hypothetical protein